MHPSPLKIYALDPAAIRVNDLIFTADGGIASKAIRARTVSTTSHVALCTKEGMLLEAIKDGALRRSVFATWATKPQWLKVYRPRESLGLNREGKDLAHYAERLYGRQYSVPAAIASAVPWLSIDAQGKVFCSQLVAQAFADYGLELLPGKAPSEITPAMLLTSKVLEKVTSKCVRVVSRQQNSDLYSWIVDTSRIATANDEMRMNRLVFDAIKSSLGPKFPANVYSLPDLRNWLLSYPGDVDDVDREILSHLQGVPYSSWYDRWLRGIEQYATLFQLLADLAETTTHEPSTELITFLRDYEELLPLSDSSLESRRLTMELYKSFSANPNLLSIVELSDRYSKEYDVFRDLNDGHRRLIAALRNSPQSSDG